VVIGQSHDFSRFSVDQSIEVVGLRGANGSDLNCLENTKKRDRVHLFISRLETLHLLRLCTCFYRLGAKRRRRPC